MTLIESHDEVELVDYHSLVFSSCGPHAALAVEAVASTEVQLASDDYGYNHAR